MGSAPIKRTRFLDTFLLYFGERWGADEKWMGSGGEDRVRLGGKKKCLQLYYRKIYMYILILHMNFLDRLNPSKYF